MIAELRYLRGYLISLVAIFLILAVAVSSTASDDKAVWALNATIVFFLLLIGGSIAYGMVSQQRQARRIASGSRGGPPTARYMPLLVSAGPAVLFAYTLNSAFVDLRAGRPVSTVTLIMHGLLFIVFTVEAMRVLWKTLDKHSLRTSKPGAHGRRQLEGRHEQPTYAGYRRAIAQLRERGFGDRRIR